MSKPHRYYFAIILIVTIVQLRHTHRLVHRDHISPPEDRVFSPAQSNISTFPLPSFSPTLWQLAPYPRNLFYPPIFSIPPPFLIRSLGFLHPLVCGPRVKEDSEGSRRLSANLWFDRPSDGL